MAIEYFGERNFSMLVSLIRTELDTFPTIDEMNTAIALSRTTQFKKVETLPVTGEAGYIYLVAASTTSDVNSYDEYYWDAETNKFEFLGTTAVDLTGYLTESEVAPMSDEKIQQLWNAAFESV